ncbi:hypothetical protein FWH13_02110 [Candidatus Saccharibacteria bacterium]|nr:hypothetical protein [Candidatus Saccharibacteria bacterium]
MFSRSNTKPPQEAVQRDRAVRKHSKRGRALKVLQWLITFGIIGGLGYLIFPWIQNLTFDEEAFWRPPEADIIVFDELGWDVTDQLSGTSQALISEVVTDLATHGITVERAVLPAGKIREFNLYLTGSDLTWRLSLDRPASGQVTDVNVVYRRIQDGDMEANDYVDLRTAGRAIYR